MVERRIKKQFCYAPVIMNKYNIYDNILIERYWLINKTQHSTLILGCEPINALVYFYVHFCTFNTISYTSFN